MSKRKASLIYGLLKKRGRMFVSEIARELSQEGLSVDQTVRSILTRNPHLFEKTTINKKHGKWRAK